MSSFEVLSKASYVMLKSTHLIYFFSLVVELDLVLFHIKLEELAGSEIGYKIETLIRISKMQIVMLEKIKYDLFILTERINNKIHLVICI